MKYSYFDTLVVRSPLRPLSELERITQAPTLAEAQSQLEAFFTQPTNREALYLASPDLEEQLTQLIAGEVTDPAAVESLRYSLMKYATRMATRPTPFGLFGSCSVGRISDRTEVQIDPRTEGTRRTRLDMAYAFELADKLAQSPALKAHLRFYPNHSLYVVGDTARYVEYQYQDNRRVYQISSIHHSEYVQRILTTAAPGAKVDTLAKSIADEEITGEEAADFVHEMIGSQLLVSELEPRVTGKESLMQLLSTLKTLPKTILMSLGDQEVALHEVIEKLESVRRTIDSFDQAESNSIVSYRRFTELIRALNTEFKPNALLQTDLTRRTTASLLSKQVALDVKYTVQFLSRIPQEASHVNIKRFADAFYQRFEDEEVPLLYALDTEAGISYLDAPLKAEKNDPHKRYIELLKEKLITALREEQREVRLTDEDVAQFAEGWSELPDTLSCFVSIFAEDNQPRVVIHGGGGSSAANLLGRFCHASPEIHEFVQEIVAAEEALVPKDALLAEIVHLPEARVGNVLLRPTLRAYEIPYLAHPSVNPEHQILPEDLMVSVRNGRVRLRSRRLNQWVIPRLSNAHNFLFNALPVYQFLGGLQNQHRREGVGFFWAGLERVHKYLPRVIYGRTILSPSQWFLSKKDIAKLTTASQANLMAAVTAWTTYWKIPPQVQLVEGDNKLFVDWRSPLSVKMFLDAVKNRDMFELQEFFFTSDNSIVKDQDGYSYINEFILSLRRHEEEKHPVYDSLPAEKVAIIPRRFAVGEEWLYYKLYCGAKSADDMLRYAIQPTVATLQSQGLVDRWFFIRYADPDHHLRLRFHTNDPQHLGDIIRMFRQNIDYFLHHRLLWKMQVDTYQRELERYGHPTMELAEWVFHLNSEMVLGYVGTEEEEELTEASRRFFGFKGIEVFLNSFDLDIQQKVAIAERSAEAFKREFNVGVREKKSLGKTFRAYRVPMEQWLSNQSVQASVSEAVDWNALSEAIAPFSEPLTQLAREFRASEAVVGSVSLEDWIGSHVHMFVNRLFATNQRYQEMTLYHLLSQYYRSVAARASKTL